MSLRRTAQAKRAPIDWLSILQFGLGALASAALLSAAGVALLNGLSVSASEGFSALALAASLSLIAVLLSPSIYYAARRILGDRSAALDTARPRYALALLLTPLALALGLWATSQNYELLIVIFHLLTVGLSVGWIAWVALRGIPLGSRQRGWGALGSGMAATPLFALIIEGIALAVAAVLVGLYVQGSPELSVLFESLQDMESPEAILEGIGKLAADPFIFVLALFGLSVFVPIVEELLKPIGVYLLLGRKLTNAQGFALGALCGAGYALAETVLNIAPQDLLLAGNVGRFGTTAMHIFTAALSGYGLARSKNEGNWLLAPLFIFASMLIHGVWNAAAVFMAVSGLQAGSGELMQISPVALAATCVLIFLAVGSILALYLFNRRLVNSRVANLSS